MSTIDFTDKGYVNKYGGGIMKLAEVLDTGLPRTYTITGISKASTAVVSTADTTGLTAGDVVLIKGVSGMTEVNGILFTVGTVVPNTSFQLVGINSTGYTTWTADGTAEVYNVITLGYLQETRSHYEKTAENINDETGDLVKALMGNATSGISGVLMESSTVLLDFLRDSTEAKYYYVYYKMTKTNDLNAKTQELFSALAVITPKWELQSGTRRPPFEITFLKNDAEITITDPDVIFGSIATADIVIAAGKYYEIVEN